MKNKKLGALVLLCIISSIVVAILAGYLSQESSDWLVSFFAGGLTALVIILISSKSRSLKDKKHALKNDKTQ